jgi:hypothetical protein
VIPIPSFELDGPNCSKNDPNWRERDEVRAARDRLTQELVDWWTWDFSLHGLLPPEQSFLDFVRNAEQHV